MKKIIIGVLLAVFSLLAHQSRAQYNQYWDNNGASAATSGNWDTTSTFWATNVLTASTVPFTNGNFAVFSAGSTTIATLNIAVTAGGVTCEGIGNATTSGGTASGARVQTLNINGPGSVTLPTGSWPFECGNYSSADIIQINTPIIGAGAVVQHNTGSIGLDGTNTYSGGTSLTGGQIVYYNNSASFGTGPISTSGGGTSFLTNSTATGPITLTNAWNINAGTTIVNFGDGNVISSGPWTLGVTPQLKANGANNLNVSGAISGGFGLILETPSAGGSITLSGPNTYTGQTTIGDTGTATVSVSSINSVSSPAPQASSSLGKPSSVANGLINLGYGAFACSLIYTGPGETSDRIINLASTTGGDTIEMDGTGPLILNGGIYASTNGAKTLTLQGTSTAANAINGCISNSTSATSVTKAQAGNWVLGGTNRFTGTLTISGGTLTIGGSGDLGGGSFAGNVNISSSSAALNYSSSAGTTFSGTLQGSGAFNLSSPAGTSVTLSGTANTYTGLFTDTSGTLSINADGSLGTVPGSVVANAITLNGGPGASLRANAAGITINPNRGITLGVNGGSVQVAGNDTCVYNGIISGSGPFQNGQNSSTGLGILSLGGSEAYTNWTILAAGTLRLTTGGSIGNSAGILMSNTPTLDVSNLTSFTLSTTNSLTIIGNSNTPTSPAIIIGPTGNNLSLGAQPVNLSYSPLWTNGDAAHTVLTVLQSELTLNGNAVNVTNASGSTLDVGNYALILCTNGFNITAPPVLNYVGNLMPNTVATLAVVNGTMLTLQVLPTASYSDSSFTNQSPYPGQSAIYGTPNATFGGQIIGPGPTYPNLGETVTIAIPNVETNTTTTTDSSGDFSLTMPINTVPVGIYPVDLSYAGNGTLNPAFDTSTYLTITKAVLTVGATNQTKTYGQTLVTSGSTAFTNSATQNGETIGSVTLTSTGSANTSPIGTYTITPSAATGGTFNANNYTITYLTATLTIVPLPVNETGTRTYDGTAIATNKILSIANIVGSDNVTNVNGGYVTLASSAAGSEPVATSGTLTIGGLRATNYTIVGMTGSVTINPLPLGLKGTNIYSGAASAPYSVLIITNVIGSDDVSLASGSATLAAASVGVQPITSAAGLVLAGTTAGNYTTTGATGSVKVNPLPIGLTGTRAYDGTATAVFSILSITNIVGSDVVNLTAGSATLASSSIGSEPITSASGLTLGGAQAADYTTTGAVGAVTVTANPNPTPIGFSYNNGALTLTWPTDHTGWTLQSQTNTITSGISNNWADVSGSSTTNQVIIPLDLSQGCVFYRLYYNP